MENGPSIHDMLLNLTGTANDAIKMAKDQGVFFASDEIIKERADVCAGCPHSTHTLGIARCRMCGCGLTLKVRIAASQCPEKRWRELNAADFAKMKAN